MTETCKHFGGAREIRNPTGLCDHLFWPENLTDVAKRANGLLPEKPYRHIDRIAELEAAINRAGALAAQGASHEMIRETLAEVMQK